MPCPQLKHAKDQLALLPSLKQKFVDLVEEHANSKTKYASSMDSLRSDLADTEQRLKRSQGEEARLQAENIAKTREVGRLGDELGKLRAEKTAVEDTLKTSERQLTAERVAKELAEAVTLAQKKRYEEQLAWSREQAMTLSANASAALASQDKRHQAKLDEGQVSALAAEYRALRCERKLLEKQDQVNRLVDLVLALEEEKTFLEEQVDDLHEEAEQRELYRLQDANLARDHAAALAERKAGLLDDLQAERTSAAGDRRLAELEREWLRDSLACVHGQIEHLQGAEAEAATLAMEKSELAQEIAGQRAELEAAHTTISSHEAQIGDLEAAVQTSHDECSALSAEVDAARADISSLQGTLSRAEEHLTSSLAQLSVRDARIDSLGAEVAALTDDLVDYLALQETHAELSKAVELLTRMSSLAQEDADELARINAELVGHSNPSQKIRHLERLRNNLAELKRVRRVSGLACLKRLMQVNLDLQNHVATLAELTAAQKQVVNLQSEIAAYKSVDSGSALLQSAMKHLQSSRSGPARSTLGHAGNGHVGVRASNNAEGLNRFQVALAAKGGAGLRLSKQRSLHDLR